MKSITEVRRVAIALGGLTPMVGETVVYDCDTGEVVDGWTSVSLHGSAGGKDWGVIVKDQDDRKILFDQDNALVFVSTPEFTLRSAKNHIKRMADGEVRG